MTDEWTPPLSGAALVDAPEHRKFLERCARELQKMESPPRTPALTEADLDRALGKLCETIGKAVRQMVVEPLERRIRELEAREWCGVWQEGKAYSKNAIITHDGSAWLATREFPEGKPGTANSGFKLIVKRGRDGRDAK